MVEEVECEGFDEMKCYVVNIGFIIDFVGERVYGWDRFLSRLIKFGVMRIGRGVIIIFFRLLGVEAVVKGGGVLRRGIFV